MFGAMYNQMRNEHFGQMNRMLADVNSATTRSANQMSAAAKDQADSAEEANAMRLAEREQNRRDYDSETSRRKSEGQMNLLSGLLSNGGMGSPYGGYSKTIVRRGDPRGARV